MAHQTITNLRLGIDFPLVSPPPTSDLLRPMLTCDRSLKKLERFDWDVLQIYLATLCKLSITDFWVQENLKLRANCRNVRLQNNIELGGALRVWVGCCCCCCGGGIVVVEVRGGGGGGRGNRKQQNSSSPPSHVEIKLSDSGVRRIFRINSSHHQLLPNFQPNFTPFHFELQSQFSFTHKTFTFEENLPFSGFPHRQCHAPILKES